MQQERLVRIELWLKETLNQPVKITPLSGDASFRRYFRVHTNHQSYILMDAPPDLEPLASFLDIQKRLHDACVPVPLVIACDAQEGFLLLSDLGDVLLLSKLKSDIRQIDVYYHKAMSHIKTMQQIPCTDLPVFNQAHMIKEMTLLIDWFLPKQCNMALNAPDKQFLEQVMQQLAAELDTLPKVFIHRDYHSRNLMVHEDELFVIDFQDAMKGPINYDLVSLLKDCYINWPRDQVVQWVYDDYKQSLWTDVLDWEAYLRAFDLCGLQRHLKVLGIFSRLYWRDGKAGYLADIPRVMDYVIECSMLYKSYQPLGQWFLEHVK